MNYENYINKFTYSFPVGISGSAIVPCFKYEKNSSTGDTSKLYGAVKINGMLRRLIQSIVSSLMLYGALSIIMTVVSLQSGRSRSSASQSFVRKRLLTLLSVLTYVKAKNISPSVSIATIIEMLGLIAFTGMLLAVPLLLQLLRL
jgi:hypothetical protein